MENAAIREGFANLRPDSDYDALYQSGLCRAKADWLVGINATRLFSVLYHKTLTVGRVQTPDAEKCWWTGTQNPALPERKVLRSASSPAA